MTADDVLATIASLPKSDKPPALRSDSVMLKVWQVLRRCRNFQYDIIVRHNLQNVPAADLQKPEHEHAWGNAIGMCVKQAPFVVIRK